MRANKVWLLVPVLGLLIAVGTGVRPAEAISEQAGARRHASSAARDARVPPRTVEGGNGLIAFQSDRADGGETQLFTTDPDGSFADQLTSQNKDTYDAAWSPDGTGLAFSNCCRDGTSAQELFTMNANGSARVRQTKNDSRDVLPSWSPDGTRIAFVSKRDGNNEIYVMNADGSGQVNQTTDRAADDTPAWSPDGKKIAFASDRGDKGNWQIYTMKPDGSNVQRLTGTDATSSDPTWSPDGTQIAFESDRGTGGDYDLFLMDADGSDETLFTTDSGEDRYPVWSPNGNKIAFASDRDGDWDIYSIKTNGSAITNLTNHPSKDVRPDWQPDTEPMFDGIDASHWQGTVDWGKVASSGMRFVFLKGTEGLGYEDPTYHDNRSEAEAAGMYTTAYHYAQPDTVKHDARDEANHFVDYVDLGRGNMVPVLDLETSNGLSPSELQNWTFNWLEQVEERLGVKPMIYTGPWFWESNMADTTEFAEAGYDLLWIANWWVEDPDVPGQNWDGNGWTFWQYDNCGTVPGISGCVDLDYYNGVDIKPALIP